MPDSLIARESYAQMRAKSPSVGSMLKISLALMLFAVSSFALVYAETISVDTGGASFDIEYDVTGMTVSDIVTDASFTSLILTVDVTESTGMLDITFERSFFDSAFNGQDDDFIVLVDGAEPIFSETSTAQSRTLSIELPAGIDEVEIIGTYLASDTDTPDDVPDTDEDPVSDTDTPMDDMPDDIPDDIPDDMPDDVPDTDEDPVRDTDTDIPDDSVPDTDEDPVRDTDIPDDSVPDTDEDPVRDTDTDVPDTVTPCGPGTILQGDTCVLDKTCGPGTVLKDGECVLSAVTLPLSPTTNAELGKDFVTGLAIAFVGAGIFGIFLGLISKAIKGS